MKSSTDYNLTIMVDFAMTDKLRRELRRKIEWYGGRMVVTITTKSIGTLEWEMWADELDEHLRVLKRLLRRVDEVDRVLWHMITYEGWSIEKEMPLHANTCELEIVNMVWKR